jgi:transposase
VVLVCDRLNAHRGGMFRNWIKRIKRVCVEYLPPYAPELNPLEYFWSYSKKNPLGNYCPEDVETLAKKVRGAAHRIRRKQNLLRSFFRATKLPMRV